MQELMGEDPNLSVEIHSTRSVSSKPICLLKELHANLQTQQETINSEVIAELFECLYTSYDTLQGLIKDAGQRKTEANRLISVVTT